MLLRTFFSIIFLAALAETIVHGAHALAQGVLRHQAIVAVHAELSTGIDAAEKTVADAIKAGADPRTLAPIAPSPQPTCILATQQGCALLGEASIAFASAASASPSPCPSGACAAYVQGNDAVDEGRIDVTVAAQIVAADGTVLASRSDRATLRTMLVAPYAVIAGNGDASLASLARGGTGNDAGAVPNGAAPGTLIDVLYENQVTGASMPANVWQPQSQGSNAGAPSWSP